MTEYKYRHRETINGEKIDIKAKSQKELTKKLNSKMEKLKLRNRDMTVSELADKWLSLKTVSPNTYKHYEIYANKIKDLDKKVTDVVVSDLQRLLNDEKDKSNSFYKKYTMILNNMFEMAVNDRIITFNPAAMVKRPAGYYNGHRAITDTERDVFLRACKNKRYGQAFLLMYYCGLRNSEVVRLKCKDIDGDIIHVRGTKSDSATRDVPIPQNFKLKLKNEYVITSENGKPVRTRTMRGWFDGIRREMNIIILNDLKKKYKDDYEKYDPPKFERNKLIKDVIKEDFTPYCLRHTYCTNLEKAGVPINVARRLMGHSSISITSKIYTHNSAEAFADAKDKINKFEGQNK